MRDAVATLALLRVATLHAPGYDQLADLVAEAVAAVAAHDPPRTVRDCPLWQTGVQATSAGLSSSSGPTVRRVGTLFDAALAACGLDKSGRLKILRAGGASHSAGSGATHDAVLRLGGCVRACVRARRGYTGVGQR